MMRAAGRFHVPADHPALPGHFPGRPIVPGVVLLDEAFAAMGCAAAGLASVKFLRPVLPGQEVSVMAGSAAGGRLGFACQVDGQDVLRGTLLLGSA